MGTKRRGRGQDSIIFDHEGARCGDSKYHRHCSGRWRGIISKGFGPDGKRIRRKVSGPTKTAVIDALAEKHKELDRGLHTSRAYTVEKAVDDWVKNGLPGRAERTRTIYQDALAPLLKKIGKKPLRELTAVQVRTALESLNEKLSSRSLQIARKALQRAIKYAEGNDKVGRNVAALVETPAGRAGRRRRAFTLSQAATVIDASRTLLEVELHPGLKDPRRPAALMHAYIVLSITAGVRTEEARALRWDHVDLEAGTVAVWRSVRAHGDTKTQKSRRSLALPRIAVEALQALRVVQADERRAAGMNWKDHDLVFTTATGAPLDARNVRRMFKVICENAGVGEDWTPQDLRHTFVSLMSDDGMAIEKISRLVGHTSSQVTETVYRQELRPVLQDGAEVMDRIFASGGH